MVLDGITVISMTQLMCQCGERIEAAVEVRQHAALFEIGLEGAERTADLAGPRIDVDPGLVKGTLDHLRDIFRQRREDLDQDISRLFNGVGLFIPAYRREEVPPGKRFLMTEEARLSLHETVQNMTLVFHDSDQYIKTLALHPVISDRHVQRRRIAALLSEHGDLRLDRIQCRRHGCRDLRVSRKFRFIRPLPHLRVRIVCQIPDG